MDRKEKLNIITVRENVPEFPLLNRPQLKRVTSGIPYVQLFHVTKGQYKGLKILASYELHQGLCWLHVSASRANCRDKIINLSDIAYIAQNFFQPDAQIIHQFERKVSRIFQINLWSCLDKQFLVDIPFNED